MPFFDSGGARLFYRLQGQDDKPVLVFAHSLGVDHGQWDQQAADLVPFFRVLRYDIRGHGASDAPTGDYTIELLGRDVLALADHLAIQQFAFCGLSLGGMIGQWLGAQAPDRITRLVLANTTPHFADSTPMETRRKSVLDQGMAAVADAALGRFFSPEPLAANLPHVATTRRTLLATNPAGYAACCAAIRDMDLRGLLPQISAPVLIIAGTRDESTPWAGNAEVLEANIQNRTAVRFGTAHLSNLERPRSFSAAVFDFLAAADDLVPIFDLRTHRLVTLAVHASLGHWDAFRQESRTALEHGIETYDLKQILHTVDDIHPSPHQTVLQLNRLELEEMIAQEIAENEEA